MTTRVVLAMDSARQRALARLGLDMSGEFEVVGVATDERDVEFVVGSLKPDVVLIEFGSLAEGGLDAVPTVHRAAPGATAVLYRSLVARHEADLSLRGHVVVRRPTPIELARLLGTMVGGMSLVSAVI